MPIKLSDLRKSTRTIEVKFLEDGVNVTYYLMVVTPEFLSEQKDTVEQIKEAVVEWDVLDDEGKKIPPVEIAGKLPVTFLNVVMEAIVTDMRGVFAEKKD